MGGIDLAGVLKLIGGIKQLKVGSVFAEGTNIIKQSPGPPAIGDGSTLNSVGSLQSAFSGGGLSSVFSNNPVSDAASSLQSLASNSITSISAITTTTTTGSGSNAVTTTVATYPLFTQALTTAESNLANYYYISQLLTGQVAPDYNNNEYGLTDILDASENGADLSDLTAPLKINSNLTTALTALTALIQSVTNKQVTDSNAVTQLNTIMAPILTAIQTSQTAYNSVSQNNAQAAVVGLAVAYVNGVPSEQGDFVQSLLSPDVASDITNFNQSALAEAESNKAEAKLAKIEKDRIAKLTIRLLNEIGLNKEP